MGSKGKITVGFGTKEQRELAIEEFVQSRFKDSRLFSILKIEDGSFAISIENPPSTGRTNQQMWLSKESLVGLTSAIMLYFEVKGENLTDLLKDATNNEKIEYSYSDNIENKMAKEL